MSKIKIIKIILFIVMLGLIYIVSPKITYLIQEVAKYIYDLDSNYITRIVELVLAVSLSVIVMKKNNSEKDTRKNK